MWTYISPVNIAARQTESMYIFFMQEQFNIKYAGYKFQ